MYLVKLVGAVAVLIATCFSCIVVLSGTILAFTIMAGEGAGIGDSELVEEWLCVVGEEILTWRLGEVEWRGR